MITQRILNIETKIEKICQDENLEFRWDRMAFPIIGTLRKNYESINQQTMDVITGMETPVNNGELCFIFGEEIQIKIDDDFSISDDIFSKLKNLFKKLHYEYLQLFFMKKMVSDEQNA